ncbi:hypothetical protein WA026_002206 [Henosepilachna vigintioctopunctata]|uniref:Mitochondrial cytochrome c oxidase subunit VIc/VIIs domain-containing protein n=1 Tax=Henosepilachna vigintioctopunctata TaxID=420089 RepID=A0AAW1TZR6_9CUCU
MGDAVGQKIPKPQMRGLLKTQITKNLIGCAILCTASVLYMKFVYGDGNKRRYAEFYKNYDINKEFNRMRRKGLFDSCNHEDADEDCV